MRAMRAMRAIWAMCGIVFTLFGFFLLCKLAWDWCDLGFPSYLRHNSPHTIPLYMMYLPPAGWFLTIFGSILILMAVKGDLSLHDKKTSRVFPVTQYIIFILLFVQCSILAFQIHELLRYSEEIEPYMPNMSREGDNAVAGFFYLGTVIIPFFAQFILMILVLLTVKNSWLGALSALFSVWFTAFSWFASYCGFVFSLLTFD